MRRNGRRADDHSWECCPPVCSLHIARSHTGRLLLNATVDVCELMS